MSDTIASACTAGKTIYLVDINVEVARMRVLIDIEAEQVERLDDLAKELRTSRAAVIRQAVRDHLDGQAQRNFADGFGIWGEGGEDGLAYQERIRAGW